MTCCEPLTVAARIRSVSDVTMRAYPAADHLQRSLEPELLRGHDETASFVKTVS